MAQNAPLIRVSRKRTADPHEALIVQIKRVKQAEPVVFTLFKTKDAKLAEHADEELAGVPVVDLPTLPESDQPMEEEEGCSNPLAFVNDSAIGQIGGEKVEKPKEADRVMLNGKVLVPVAQEAQNSPEDDVVFDYYKVRLDNDCNVALYSHKFLESNAVSHDTFDVRFASRYEAELVNPHESDNDSDIRADDDDDSNAEDNWRNDYPDEDSYDENSDSDDIYGELTAENWHNGENAFPDEGIHRRFANFAINDRYESYFEGEDTEDDGEQY
ncbi:unnamed protein product [Caenorhabditis bovis]|uniref:Probable RNA polymerase II nuclear localization protein SLC7A6OS n=1 Tax=Caenorhabditis bovis TaxID=2654633 RepID=A0A8S1EJT3_9PELO|nr:unnamed protein product [Caenorhabditis bovis]